MTQSWWPKSGDTVFREGFDADTTAELDWIGLGTQIAYADGYNDAAELLIEAVEERRLTTHPDRLFYPIAFLYRHSVEIRLKQIIAASSYYLTGSIDFNWLHSTHNLHKLWHRARKLASEVHPDSDQIPFANTEKVIVQLHRLDQDGTAFRYALTKEGRQHGLKDAPRRVDLVNVREVMKRLRYLLDTCLDMIDEAAQGHFEL